jgi:hypothetical protein
MVKNGGFGYGNCEAHHEDQYLNKILSKILQPRSLSLRIIEGLKQ